MASLSQTRSRASVYIPGPTAESTKAGGTRASSMATVGILAKTGLSSMGYGSKESASSGSQRTTLR